MGPLMWKLRYLLLNVEHILAADARVRLAVFEKMVAHDARKPASISGGWG